MENKFNPKPDCEMFVNMNDTADFGGSLDIYSKARILMGWVFRTFKPGELLPMFTIFRLDRTPSRGLLSTLEPPQMRQNSDTQINLVNLSQQIHRSEAQEILAVLESITSKG